MNKAFRMTGLAAICAGGFTAAVAAEPVSPANSVNKEKTRKIRFIEDDAQEYMISKVYTLKHIKANDIVPFVLGAVKRYSNNSKVDRINYSAGKQQWIVVTTPAPMMRYVDDMIAKMDRPSGSKDADGSIVKGTGVTRYVYNPQWRSSADMVKLMVKAGISGDADEAYAAQDGTYKDPKSSTGKFDSRIVYDATSNLIYWKDSANKSKDLLKYLKWLDRPVPQVLVTFKLYEVRDSDLTDIGIDYAAWKNGPGLQLAGFGADLFSGRWNETVQIAQLANKLMPFISDSMSWGYGAMFFAPAFDMSFIRILQQNGKARQLSTVTLALRNGKTASATFTPDYQNILKKDNDKTYVEASQTASLKLTVSAPAICYDGKSADGAFDFSYALSNASVVERNNYGSELSESTAINGFGTIRMKQESFLTGWTRQMDVEQTIGVPFLCEIPVLKYIFGTTTRNVEKTHFFLTAESEFVTPDTDISRISGKLTEITELVQNEK